MNDTSIHIPHKNTEPLVIGNLEFRSIYDFTLTEKDLERARHELGESEERKEACLRELKEKLLNDATVKYRLDDSYLLRFLRRKKYDVLKAYQNLNCLYSIRKKHANLFDISPRFKSIQELNMATGLPYTDEEGRVLFMLNFERWNPYETSFEEIFQSIASVIDLGLVNQKCQINGIIAIYDCSGLSTKHVSELIRNGHLWTYYSLVLNAYPVRIKKIIILNTNRFVRYLYNIMKPFLQRKITERVFLLGSDANDLHQHVNPVLLPKRFNGNLEEEECNVSQFVLDNLPYLRYERSFIPLN